MSQSPLARRLHRTSPVETLVPGRTAFDPCGEAYPHFKAQARRTKAATQAAFREVQEPWRSCWRSVSRPLLVRCKPRALGLGEAHGGVFRVEAEHRLMVIDGD